MLSRSKSHTPGNCPLCGQSPAGKRRPHVLPPNWAQQARAAKRVPAPPLPTPAAEPRISCTDPLFDLAAVTNLAAARAARASQAPAGSASVLATVLESITQGIAVYGADLTLRFWNRRYAEILSLEPSLLAIGTVTLGDILLHLALRGEYGEGDPATLANDLLTKITGELLAGVKKTPTVWCERQTRAGTWLQANWNALPDGGLVVMVSDITVEKAARDEAVRARQQMATAIESMSEGFVLWDAQDRLVLFNTRYRDQYSFAPEVLRVGISFEALLREGVRRGAVPVGYDAERWVQERLEQHRNPRPPYVVERPDARSVLITEHRTADGGVVGIRTDVTELHAREQAARAARRLLVEALEAIPQGFAIFDPDDRLAMFNRRYVEEYSLVPDLLRPGVPYEALPRAAAERGLVDVPPERREAWIRERVALHRAGKRKFTTRRQGRWVAVEESRTESGHIVVMHTDVTDLVERENEAKRSRQLLRDVIDAVPAVINVKDADSRYVLMNRFQGEVYGVAPEGAIGKTSADFVGPAYGGCSRAMDEEVLRTGQPLPWSERKFAGKEGRTYTWLNTKVPLKDAEGRTENVLTVALDITKLTALERARTNLARYLPPNLVDVMAREDEPFGPPRAQKIGVLFADIVGFTGMAAEDPPEAVFALLREFQSRLAGAVFACGGTLDEFTGDGVMATFGTPYSSGRDAGNALDCARRIVDEVASLNRERGARGEPSVRVSVGVHYGEALLGHVGDERRMKFAVVGDTVNVASRLETLTRELDAAIVASDALVRQARSEGADAAGFVALGARTLRGRHAPLDLWTLPRG